MKKRNRLAIVLVVVALSAYFIFPTIKWYGFVPQEVKELATGSNVQIKEYSRGQATRELRALKELVAKDGNAPLPSEYSFLKSAAKENYKAMRKPVPKKWTVTALLAGFYNEQNMFDAIESYHRNQL